MELKEAFISREEIYDGAVLHVVRDRVALPDGSESFREIALHRGAVAAIPVTEDGEIILVRQYRYAHGRVFLELPAGKLEPGEDPAVGAARELAEETGAVAAKLTPLGIIDTTPALISERIHLFLAEGLTFTEASPDEGEFVTTERIPLSELVGMVERGEICDSKTQIGILKLARIYRI